MMNSFYVLAATASDGSTVTRRHQSFNGAWSDARSLRAAGFDVLRIEGHASVTDLRPLIYRLGPDDKPTLPEGA